MCDAERVHVNQLQPSIASIQQRIARAAARSGRPTASVRLVAVSKRHPASAIRAAYACGVRDFGENYVQELVGKANELSDLPDIAWHMIGHLQSNKARHLAKLVTVIHTVDSRELAEELARRAARAEKRVGVLIEVNVAKDPAKSGCSAGELADVMRAVQRFPKELELRGLMTMPPYAEDLAETRRHFATLRTLRALHGGGGVLPELSMGMSHDFEAAIEEGATIVRIGTAIFGERPRPPSP